MKKNTLKDEIRNKILFEIVSGNLSLNEVITEGDLIKRFKASKSPIREALIELCNENVLESMPRYGYKIVPLNAKNIKDATEVRLLLEISSLKQSFANLDSYKIDLLKKQNESNLNIIETKDEWTHWNYNSEFHLLLISFANNQLKYEMLKKTLGILFRAFAQYYSERWKNIAVNIDVKRHTDIIYFLEKQDYDGAVKLLREDIVLLEKEVQT